MTKMVEDMKTITENSLKAEAANDNININEINSLLVQRLAEKGIKIATAESCTGGLISKKITEISGASAVFDCGVCSYSNEIKSRVLKVSKATLDAVGAVSEETAVEMAQGVRELANSCIGVSTTGIAGPTGGTPQKPVGLVYIGVSTKDKAYAVKALLCENKVNNRERVRELAAAAAMYLAYKEVNSNSI